MIVKLLTEHHLEFLNLKGGCTGSSESTHVKMPHCWKSHATALLLNSFQSSPAHVLNLANRFHLYALCRQYFFLIIRNPYSLDLCLQDLKLYSQHTDKMFCLRMYLSVLSSASIETILCFTSNSTNFQQCLDVFRFRSIS